MRVATNLLRASALAVLALAVTPAPFAMADAPPADPQANGYIGLCDGRDHAVTGGSLDAEPFVWKAVSSVAAPPMQQGTGENAVLEIYQVRPGVEPQEWSGDQLTATSFYRDRHAPAAQATRADLSLRTVVDEFPPRDDGLYQLRMYFGRVDHGVYGATYPATYVRVTGDSWQLVAAGPAHCAGATAISNEVLTGVVTRGQGEPPPSTPDSVRSGSSGTGPSGATLAGWGLGATAVAAAGCVLVIRLHRRRVTEVSPSSPSTRKWRPRWLPR